MTIHDCLDACFDRGLCKARIILWHDYPEETRCETVYEGPGDEIPDRFDDMEFDSYDVPRASTMTFNVHLPHNVTKADERKKYGPSFARPGKVVKVVPFPS